MYTLDEKPETIHLYVVREETPRPQLFPIIISSLALLVLAALCTLFPYQQPVTHVTLRVPAVPLLVKSFTAQAAIVPTSIKTYLATTAHGVLTITNGSVITQELPAGLIFTTNRGIQIVTDSSVFVPSGNANSYGYAMTAAHLSIAGMNLPTLAINQVLGTSLYVRNLQPFTGGRPAYSVKVVTEEDRQLAVYKTRNVLAMLSAGLHYPCYDVLNIGKEIVSESWQCQFVTFNIPRFYHVTGIKLVGKNLILSAWFIERPIYRPVK
jgi:hypothetical protein